eukprot:Awhi_evm1s1122
MLLAHQLLYLENEYQTHAANLTFENIHTDTKVAHLFRLFLIRQYCSENLDAYEKIIEYENMFFCNCSSSPESNSIDQQNPTFTVIWSNDCSINSSSELEVCDCADRNQIYSCMTDIIKQFINSTSKYELNLPATVKSAFIERLVSMQERAIDDDRHCFTPQRYVKKDRFLFEQVKVEVRSILENDLFQRFVVDINKDYVIYKASVNGEKTLRRAESFDFGLIG